MREYVFPSEFINHYVETYITQDYEETNDGKWVNFEFRIR